MGYRLDEDGLTDKQSDGESTEISEDRAKLKEKSPGTKKRKRRTSKS